MTDKLTPREKISKAKISLLNKAPFFGSLTIHLNPLKVDFIPTMGVDEYGNFYYNDKFVDTLTDEECEAVLCHEVLHCVFKDLERKSHRQEFIWNLACDFANNLILNENGFKLPKGRLLNSAFKDKIKEEIYELLMDNPKKYNIPGICKSTNCKNCKVMKGKKNKQVGGICRKGVWDYHLTDKDAKEGMGKHIKNKTMSEKDWRGIVANAYETAKRQGNMPYGLDRIFKKLFPAKVNWKSLLLRFIESYIPRDYTWRRPSKRSASIGVYLPRTLKEFVKVTVAIDTSGSISDEEYDEFISECVGIANAFPSIKMTIISCDCQIQHVYEVDNNFNPYDVVCKGRGGTDHVVLFKYIKKHKPDTKLLVCFTDGYTTYPPKNSDLYKNLNVLWIFTKEHGDINQVPYGRVVLMHSED